MTYVSYDTMTGPDLDRSLWSDFELGGVPRTEPDAVTTVADGAVTVDIPAFRNGDENSQGMDNTKHLVLSTRTFPLPERGVARFAVDVHVDHVGMDDDYRLGVATLNVFAAATGQVWNALATADRVFAEHELLAADGYTRVVESPHVPTGQDAFRELEVEIDRGRGHVTWRVNGAVIHEASGLTDIADEVSLGYQVVTMMPISSGQGSRRGQGARVTWRNFRYDLG